jgi:hypothetical protein
VSGESCLSDDQIGALQRAVPGQAPIEIARHLAACARCQERALLGSEVRPERRVVRPPSLQRSLVLTAAVLLALLMFFYSVVKLAGLG